MEFSLGSYGYKMKMTESQIEAGRKNLMKTNLNSSIQRKRRINQLRTEEFLANRLRRDGWQIFSPTVVCDRIGIKDNKVFFIEFKKNGQKLKEGQNTIKESMPNNYIIIYH